MKVKDLIEIQTEYTRLDGLIDAIEEILKRLIEPEDAPISNIFGGVQVHISVSLPAIDIPDFVGDLIRYDLIDLLQRHVTELKRKQDALEI